MKSHKSPNVPKSHVGFKLATEMGERYYQVLDVYAKTIGWLVTENLLEKHIQPVFVQP